MSIQIPLPRILVYQDEDCSILIDYLTFCGFEVINTSEEDVLKKLQKNNYDLCILGHFKANMPGDLKLLHFLRNINKKMPIIFVSDLFDYSYIIEAFNAGVDDYVVRPYNLEELVCRIKALLARCGIKVRSVEQVYKIGDYVFNTEKHMLKSNSTEIRLTYKENETLALLCAYKNELLPKGVLLHTVWADDNYFIKRSLDVHICRLRNFLKQDKRISIDTIKGFGYSLVVKDENE